MKNSKNIDFRFYFVISLFLVFGINLVGQAYASGAFEFFPLRLNRCSTAPFLHGKFTISKRLYTSSFMGQGIKDPSSFSPDKLQPPPLPLLSLSKITRQNPALLSNEGQQLSVALPLLQEGQHKMTPQQFKTQTIPISENEKTESLAQNNLPQETFSLLDFDQFSERYIALDTEATNSGNVHKLIEIGCVEIVNFQETGNKFHVYINPECEVNSYVYKLTGLTWKYLCKHPLFLEISSDFLRFIRGARLIIHDAHYDLKLLNEALESCGNPYGKLEQQHKIIDTLLWAKKLHPDKKNNLNALCERYNVDVSSRVRHGALIDAKLLAEVYCAMMRQNEEMRVQVDVQSAHTINYDNRFETIRKTVGEKYFREKGIKGDLSPAFFFTSWMYHPHLRKSYPAILVAFTNGEGNLTGLDTRYLISDSELSKSLEKIDNAEASKIFYGSAQNATVDIHRGNSKIIFIGTLLNALVCKDILLGGESYNDLDLKEGFSVKAYLDISCLPTITFDSSIRRIVILIDQNEKNEEDLKQVLRKAAQRFFNPRFEGLLSKIEQEPNLKNFIVRYGGQHWTVTADYTVQNKRHIQLRRKKEYEVTIVVDETRKSIMVQNTRIHNPNTAILVANPRMTLKIVSLRTKLEREKSITQMAQEHPEQIVKRIRMAYQVRSMFDLDLYLLKEKLQESEDYKSTVEPTKKNIKDRALTGYLKDDLSPLQKNLQKNRNSADCIFSPPKTELMTIDDLYMDLTSMAAWQNPVQHQK